VREREESEKREREKRMRKKAARRPDTWHKVAEPPVAPEQRTRLYHAAHVGAI
jgi:hypothetical protein